MQFPKYIVPLYVDNEFVGTGFIVNGFLITADHVIRNKVRSSFFYENNHISININSIVVSESLTDPLSDDNVCDLFVCKTEITESNLIFSSKYNSSKSFEYYGYSYDNEINKLVKDYKSDIEFYRSVALSYSNYTKLNNCISLHCKLKPGNSGGPIFQDGNVVGMVIKDISHINKFSESIIIKSDYIQKAIENSNHINQ